VISKRHTLNQFIGTCCICLLGLFPLQAFSANTAMLELIEILHNKGSITGEEYQLLKSATMQDQEQTEVAQTELKQELSETSAAGWTSNITMKGDVRLRYQAQDNDPGISRGRGRLRYRLGVIAKPTEGWEVGSGLASGSSDLRSTNQSFDSTFSTKGINLDYAYAQYQFNDQIKAIGGKFKRSGYLYSVSDLLWDGDINPEGFSVNFKHSSEMGTTFSNSGIWVLEENSSSSDDPYLFYLQLGQNFGGESLFGTVTGSYYTFQDISTLGSIVTEGTNSDINFGSIFSISGEVGLKGLFGNSIRTSLVAEWVNNGDTDSNQNSGYLLGLKVSGGPWSASYNYVDLERNAWPDILPDSDRFDGLTGTKGHEITLSYTLMKNVAIGIDYYAVENSVFNENQDLLQLDLNVSF
jgi:hypothetical protein